MEIELAIIEIMPSLDFLFFSFLLYEGVNYKSLLAGILEDGACFRYKFYRGTYQDR